MYERVSSDETIHTLPLGELNVRVCVDFVIIPHALLPIPIPGEATSVGEAVGYELAWPKNLVLVNDEVILFIIIFFLTYAYLWFVRNPSLFFCLFRELRNICQNKPTRYNLQS